MNGDTHGGVALSGRPVRRSDLTVHELDGEALIYDSSSADTHRLNTTAHFIWCLCDGRHDATAMARRLTEAYDVSQDSALEHVERLLADFRERNLLQRV